MIEDILNKLNSSKFRSSFHLKSGDVNYIKEKSLSKIESHTLDFINKRLKDVSKVNDGKQKTNTYQRTSGIYSTTCYRYLL